MANLLADRLKHFRNAKRILRLRSSHVSVEQFCSVRANARVICVQGGAGDGEQCAAELPELSDGVPGGCFCRLPQLGQRGPERKCYYM